MKWIILVCVLHSMAAQALEFGCTLRPDEIGPQATRLIQTAYNSQQSLADNNVLYFNTEAEVTNRDANLVGTYEAFLRPKDGVFYPLPIPILTARLTRSNDFVYVCGHSDIKPDRDHLTIYFLHGHKLDSGFSFDFLHGPGAEISSVDLTVNGVPQVGQTINKIVSPIPLINVISRLSIGLLAHVSEEFVTTLANAVNKLVGGAVERIVLTPNEIRLEAGIDLQNPDQAKTSIRVRLDDLN